AVQALEEAKKAKSPAPPRDWSAVMVDAQHNLAAVLQERKEWAKAAEALREAIRHQKVVVGLEAGREAAAKLRLASYYQGLLGVLLQQKDHAAAARCAEEFGALRGEGVGWREPLRVAAVLARCITLADEDEGLEPARRKELTRSYGDAAMARLGEAVDRGYRDADQLSTNPALQPLAGR